MNAPRNLAELAQRFDDDRRHLRSVAFQLLGSLADADDAVQSAWLKASRADFAAVDNLSGWFTTITAREALDQLRARKRRAELPLAAPEELDRLAVPASSPADEDTLLAESVSTALLVVLDRLSPAQRVAFVLHDVFAMPFETIAELLNRSPDAAKKLASRARAGAVMLIDGTPGIVIAARGRAQILLMIGIGADDRIHTIDITGDPERIRRATLALPPAGRFRNITT